MKAYSLPSSIILTSVDMSAPQLISRSEEIVDGAIFEKVEKWL